ncbi:hypothetical protein NECAME_14764 [Necator americanus]|uniref:EGF-like domain-containing protein n=1 Tax=Necator americanus TaxID=51031 RepID=W2SL87_NECAM|nr:hypothetical protein NECAME_14764 [Necator americanus]ETN70434.1 hypothetical protein NECAME_14764 [Necator americanus]
MTPHSRIFVKRDVSDNIRKNDPKSKCRNGGIYAGGQCHCIHPHTGRTCEEFACVHGISVGRRYDPLSLIFSKPCICNEGWKGDLCEYHLTDREEAVRMQALSERSQMLADAALHADL